MESIYAYHFVWYLLGIIFAPRLTIMIFLSLHILNIPLWFMLVGWIFAILGLVETKSTS